MSEGAWPLKSIADAEPHSLRFAAPTPAVTNTLTLELRQAQLHEVSSVELDETIYRTAWEPSPPRCPAHLKEKCS